MSMAAEERLRDALKVARDFIAHHPAVRGEWPVVLDVIDRALALPVERGPECITRSGRPNWCDVHGDRPHTEAKGSLTMAGQKPRYGRCSESIGDGRQWVDNTPLFSTAANFFTVLPSEYDMAEVGQRVAVAYAKEWADHFTTYDAFRQVRMLHPAEFAKVGR